MSFVRDILFGRPPPAPDYAGAAQQQGQQSLRFAKLNAKLNRLDETTPYGSVDYRAKRGPDGKPLKNQFERIISLSPEQQRLYDLESGNAISSQGIAKGLQGALGDAVRNPFSLAGFGNAERVGGLGDPMRAGPGSRDEVEKALMSRYDALMQPDQERATAQLDTQLRNQGLMPGTEAYDAEVRKLRTAQDQTRQDAMREAVVAGGAEESRATGLDLAKLQQALTQRLQSAGFNNQTRGQSIQEALLQRQQPLSEFNAFRTGNTPTIPQFQPYGQVNAQPGNFQAAAGQAGQYGMDRYNAGVGAMQSLLNFGSSVYGAK
jgi:hypothetical protein